MSNDQGKTALITGASSGIGRGIALRLAKDGINIVVNYRSGKDAAAKVVAEIEKNGGSAIAIQADVTKVEDRERLISEATDAYGALDILVNNAGIATLGPIEDVTEEDWDRLYDLNAKAPFFLTQRALERMSDGGRIVFVSSSTASFPMKETALYASSKMPVRTIAEVLAKELGPKGISVNSVIPGPTAPGMFADAPDHLKEMAAGTSPFDRIGQPEDIAAVVAFLVSEEAKWVTGQNILANGGATM